MTALTLTITTPLTVILRADGLRSVRAADESGDFGIWPGHVPLLTVLHACVVRWRSGPGAWSYCALRGGVMTVERGSRIRIACRQGVLGGDLDALTAKVAREARIEQDAARAARIQQARMHTEAVRQIMRHISGTGGPAFDAAMDGFLS